jgi:hypothetical protein
MCISAAPLQRAMLAPQRPASNKVALNADMLFSNLCTRGFAGALDKQQTPDGRS